MPSQGYFRFQYYCTPTDGLFVRFGLVLILNPFGDLALKPVNRCIPDNDARINRDIDLFVIYVKDELISCRT